MARGLIFLLFLGAGPATGAGLPDPTRPALPAVQEGAEAAAVSTGPRLTMVRIGGGRRMAVIDGQEVTLGSRVNDMRVVRIDEGAVVLKSPSGTEVLKLLPEVEKRTLRTRSPDKEKTKRDVPASRKAQP